MENKFKNPWPPVSPQDEKRYDIQLHCGTTVEGVEYWAFGGGFGPVTEKGKGLVKYPLEHIISFQLSNSDVQSQAKDERS